MTSRRAADLLADTMIAHRVSRAFCVPGESYLSLLDALYDRPAIDLVVARHEGGAGFMAVADAKCAGRPGVCLVSRGPGATNAAIAIHTAEQDATPLVAIIGQVPRADCGRRAFQEIDYTQMYGGIAKRVWQVGNGDDLACAFADAHALALAPTPGPVVLVVPEDVFDESTGGRALAPTSSSTRAIEEEHVRRVEKLLACCDRPLLIAGHELDSAAGREALRQAAERHVVPVALAYKRQDLFDNASGLFAGYLGFKIPRAQVALLRRSDVIIAVGTRLGDVTTQNYTLPRAPAPEQRLAHVCADARELGRLFRTDVAIAADPVGLLQRLGERPCLEGREKRAAWAEMLHGAAAALAAYSPAPRADGVEFGAVVQALARRAARDAVVSMDGGNFGGWVHRLWPWTPANRLIGTAGGAMGMGVPGAVAAALHYPGRQVLAFVGDGGFMMTGTELATAVQRDATLTVVVSNNRCFGTIRQHQDAAYGGRIIGTELPSVDFAGFAEACGSHGFRITSLRDIDAVVDAALASPGVSLIDVRTSLEPISAYSSSAAATGGQGSS